MNADEFTDRWNAIFRLIGSQYGLNREVLRTINVYVMVHRKPLDEHNLHISSLESWNKANVTNIIWSPEDKQLTIVIEDV